MKSVYLYRRNWNTVIGNDVFKIDDWAGQLKDIQEAEAIVQKGSAQYNSQQIICYLGILATFHKDPREKASKHPFSHPRPNMAAGENAPKQNGQVVSI